MQRMGIGGLAVVAAVTALTGCQQKPDDAAIAECWGPDAKQMVVKLSKESIEDKIVDALKAAGQPITADGRQKLESRLQVTANSFFTSSIDRASNAAHCSADLSIMLTRPDGKQLMAGPESQVFDIYQGESGRMYSLPQTLTLQRLVNTLGTSAETDAPTKNDQGTPPPSAGDEPTPPVDASTPASQ